MMLFRQQAALHYEAAQFVADARHNYDEIEEFITSPAPRGAGGLAGDGRHQGWIGRGRVAAKPPVRHLPLSRNAPGESGAWRGGSQKALEAAAEVPGTIFIGDDMGSVRFWFADEVARHWVPNDTPEQVATIVALRESMLALAQFAQRAFAAYSGSRPSGTFVENPDS